MELIQGMLKVNSFKVSICLILAFVYISYQAVNGAIKQRDLQFLSKSFSDLIFVPMSLSYNQI